MNMISTTRTRTRTREDIKFTFLVRDWPRARTSGSQMRSIKTEGRIISRDGNNACLQTPADLNSAAQVDKVIIQANNFFLTSYPSLISTEWEEAEHWYGCAWSPERGFFPVSHGRWYARCSTNNGILIIPHILQSHPPPYLHSIPRSTQFITTLVLACRPIQFYTHGHAYPVRTPHTSPSPFSSHFSSLSGTY